MPEPGVSAFTKFVEIGQTVEGGKYVKEMGFETSSSTGTAQPQPLNQLPPEKILRLYIIKDVFQFHFKDTYSPVFLYIDHNQL